MSERHERYASKTMILPSLDATVTIRRDRLKDQPWQEPDSRPFIVDIQWCELRMSRAFHSDWARYPADLRWWHINEMLVEMFRAHIGTDTDAIMSFVDKVPE